MPNLKKIFEGTAYVGVSCSQCGEKTIVGKRFTCLTCRNIDLCEKCEAEGHKHAMIRTLSGEDADLIEKVKVVLAGTCVSLPSVKTNASFVHISS